MRIHPAIANVLICVLIGLAFGVFFYFAYDHRPMRIAISVLSTVTIGSMMMLAIHFRFYFTPFFRQEGARMLVMIIVLTAVALGGTETTLFIQSLFFYDEAYRPFGGGSIYFLNILVVLVSGIPIYVSEESKSRLTTRIADQQYRLLQLEQQRTQAELQLLRAKINPHFLYNVHNTIAGLIPKDPSKAEQLVLLLSGFFHYTLGKDSNGFHSIREELEIAHTWLRMQQMRFGERMSYAIQAAPDVLDWPIPSFLLQPLIENAVKHGIEPAMESGWIEIKIEPDQSNILIRVADSGAAFPGSPGVGHGLQLVIGKLRLLYGDNFSFELNNDPKYVHLLIPGRDQNAAGR